MDEHGWSPFSGEQTLREFGDAVAQLAGLGETLREPAAGVEE
jgi:hypothetical protein